MHAAWSGSNLGPQALMYYSGFREPKASAHWDSEWGFIHDQPGWISKSDDEIRRLVEAGAMAQFDNLDAGREALRQVVDGLFGRLQLNLDEISTALGDSADWQTRRSAIESLSASATEEWLGHTVVAPRPGNLMTRDSFPHTRLEDRASPKAAGKGPSGVSRGRSRGTLDRRGKPGRRGTAGNSEESRSRVVSRSYAASRGGSAA